MTSRKHVAIIGAGPAGLTAAYLLTKSGVEVTVLEADERYVGGISRTVEYKGFCFDIGGHRFFSKSKQVEELWSEILPHDMIERPRSSRIYYSGKYFSYPLKPTEALLKLGAYEAAHCVASYAKARALPVDEPDNFEDWVVNQFGRRLYEIFFKHYTEKVWGMSCREISADWAAQRIKGLSLTSAVLSAVPWRKRLENGAVIKTLIDTYRYPRKGPGMLWDACTVKVRAQGGQVRLGRYVSALKLDEERQTWRVTHRGQDGSSEELVADHVISSAPMKELVNALDPGVSSATRDAANALRYRDFLIVTLMLKGDPPFADNWVYIQDPGVKCGRVQNFKSWSPEMVPDPAYSSLGCEYFCHQDDGLWSSRDDDLMRLASREMVGIGLLESEAAVVDSSVVRQPKAYPVYDADYAKNVDAIRRELEARFPNLHLVGRNGMHKYNNQDHSMMTAMLCAENIIAGRQVYNLWRVNQDAEYHESGEAGSEGKGGRLVPERLRRFTSRPPRAQA